MALHFNFYHELHKEEYDRARDPMKLAMKGGMIALLLLAGYYAYRFQQVSVIAREAARQQAEWTKLEPLKAAAEAREEELLTGQKVNEKLVDRLQKRFLWAPVLALLHEAATPSIQLQQVSAETLYDTEVRPELQLFGVAAGVEPRRVAEEYRLKLQEVFSKKYAGVSVIYDGTNSLEETQDVIDTEEGVIGVARFRLKAKLGQPHEVISREKTLGENESGAAVGKTGAAAGGARSTPSKIINGARSSLSKAAQTRKGADVDKRSEKKKTPNAAEVARQKGKP